MLSVMRILFIPCFSKNYDVGHRTRGHVYNVVDTYIYKTIDVTKCLNIVVQIIGFHNKI